MTMWVVRWNCLTLVVTSTYLQVWHTVNGWSFRKIVIKLLLRHHSCMTTHLPTVNTTPLPLLLGLLLLTRQSFFAILHTRLSKSCCIEVTHAHYWWCLLAVAVFFCFFGDLFWCTARETFVCCPICHVVSAVCVEQDCAKSKVEDTDDNADSTGSNMDVSVLAPSLDAVVDALITFAIEFVYLI